MGSGECCHLRVRWYGKKLTEPQHVIHDVVEALPKHPIKRYERRSIEDITHIAIHHSAGPGTATPLSIARFHIGPARNWPGIAYHYFIQSDGTISQTNYHETMSFHVGGDNKYSLGICLDGNFVSQSPDPIQIASLVYLLDKLRDELPSLRCIQAHKMFPGETTSCCGDLRRAWYKKVAWEKPENEKGETAGPVAPALAVPTVIPKRINLLPYWRGELGLSHNLRSYNEDGSENNETVQMLPDGENRWLQLKNRQFETYWLDEFKGRQFIWQGADCSPGGGRVYLTWFNGEPGSPVIPVDPYLGEIWENDEPHWVQFYLLKDGSFSERNSGWFTNRIKFRALHKQMTFVNGVTVDDVAQVGWDGLENRLMAKYRGLSGWSRDHFDPHSPQSSGVSEIHEPFSRQPDPLTLPVLAEPKAVYL